MSNKKYHFDGNPRSWISWRSPRIAFLLGGAMGLLVACGGVTNSNSGDGSQTNGDPIDPTQLNYAYINTRVFHAKCIQCHGDSGGVNLESYENVVANSEAIVGELTEGAMPPTGPMDDASVKLVKDWIAAGAPRD